MDHGGLREAIASAPVLSTIVSGVLGLLGGILSNLIVPWGQWSIEKKKNRENTRRQLIEETRNFIDTSYNQQSFSETLVYSKLRPHLSKSLREDIDSTGGSGREIVIFGSLVGGDPIRQRILEEIAALEKKWKLI
jgi:hypothetical protein